MTTPGAVTVISTVEPQNDGLFPVVDDVDVRGGYHACADTTERDALPDYLLRVGTGVGVSDGTVYVLTSLSPKTWAEVSGGGGGGGGGGRSGITMHATDTFDVSFAADSKRDQRRVATGNVTVDGVGYVDGIDVILTIENSTGGDISVSFLADWDWANGIEPPTSLAAGARFQVRLWSLGTVETATRAQVDQDLVGVEVLGSDTIAPNFSTSSLKTRAASGTITLNAATGMVAGRPATVIIDAGASTRTISSGSETWVWLTPEPTTLPATKRGVLGLTSTGTTDGAVYASWLVEP
jgi:hypothetical protein